MSMSSHTANMLFGPLNGYVCTAPSNDHAQFHLMMDLAVIGKPYRIGLQDV